MECDKPPSTLQKYALHLGIDPWLGQSRAQTKLNDCNSGISLQNKSGTNLQPALPMPTAAPQEQQASATGSAGPIDQLCALLTQLLGQNGQQLNMLQNHVVQNIDDRWSRLKFPELRPGGDVNVFFCSV